VLGIHPSLGCIANARSNIDPNVQLPTLVCEGVVCYSLLIAE
jgi:hypothetical protein